MPIFLILLLAIPCFGQGAADVEALKRAAESGDAKAQLRLAEAYEDGNGVPQNDGLSIQWLRRAAEAGNADAQNSLGVAYRMGRGVGKDFKEAVAWYRKAAFRGSGNAMHNLATVYFNGEGESINDELALVWFLLAEKNGVVGASEAVERVKKSIGPNRTDEALLKLGEFYEKGESIPRDYAEALRIYKSLDSPLAAMRVAIMYNEGKGVDQDVRQAFEWCSKSAKRNHPPALYCVAQCYHRGLGTRKDFKLASEYYERAGLAGIPKAFDLLGLIYASGALGRQDLETALMFHLLAERMGIEPAKASVQVIAAQLKPKQVEMVRKKALEYWGARGALLMYKR